MHGPTCIFWANLTPCSLKAGAGSWGCNSSTDGVNDPSRVGGLTCDTQTNIIFDVWNDEYAMYTRDWLQVRRRR
jgi:hypothetical protein